MSGTPYCMSPSNADYRNFIKHGQTQINMKVKSTLKKLVLVLFRLGTLILHVHSFIMALG